MNGTKINIEKLSDSDRDLLDTCVEFDEIDEILTRVGLGFGINERNEFLMNYMGVLGAFSSCDMDIDSDMELQYELTKEVFIDGDWKYMSERGINKEWQANRRNSMIH